MNYLSGAVAMSQGQQLYLSEGQLFLLSEGQPFCLSEGQGFTPFGYIQAVREYWSSPQPSLVSGEVVLSEVKEVVQGLALYPVSKHFKAHLLSC